MRGSLTLSRMMPLLFSMALACIAVPQGFAQSVPSAGAQDGALPRQDGTLPQGHTDGWPVQTAQNQADVYDMHGARPRDSQSASTNGARAEEAGQNAVPSDGRVGRRGGMDMQYDNRVTTRGSVVKSSRNTMVVRTDNGRHVLFAFDRDAERPQTISVGTRVRVVSRPGDDGIQVASYVAQDNESPDASAIDRSYGGDDPVPDDIRRLERQVARQARRFRAGVRAGAGLDPEILTAGVHATMGPFFSEDVWFRPNAEFGFGEVTKMFAINLEGIYRLPVNSRQSQWMVYAGAGPGVNFISRNYEKAQSGDRDIDFSDFDFEAGLNFLVGVERRSGMFLEFKASAYSSPNVRFLVGYNF